MSGDIVSFRPPGFPPSDVEPAADADMLANVVAFCERLNEGLQHVAETLIAMDARLRRLELDSRAAARAAARKNRPAILNPEGTWAN